VLAGNSLNVVSIRIVAGYLRRLRRDLPDKVGSNACRDQRMSLTFLRQYEGSPLPPPPPLPTEHTPQPLQNYVYVDSVLKVERGHG